MRAPAWLPEIDWSPWTVILLKPDCLAAGLVDQILDVIRAELTVLTVRKIRPTEAQIFAHYDDMLPLSERIGRDVPAELRRLFVGRPTGIALAHGPHAAPRLRAILGPTDPAAAPHDTIRGRFGTDSLRVAMAENRLVDNLIHSSDDVASVSRDFGIWFGPSDVHLLAPPARQGDPL